LYVYVNSSEKKESLVIRTVAQKQHIWTNAKYSNASPFWVMVLKNMAVDKTKVLWGTGG
jgi:hypothetical protein